METQNRLGSRIAFGVCGGIAAYKAAESVRLLSQAGHDVHTITTQWGARCSVWRVEDVRAWIAANGGQGGAE